MLFGGAAIVVVGLLPALWPYGDSVWIDGEFPLATSPSLAGLLLAARVAATTFGGVKLPRRLWRYSWAYVDFFLAGYAFVVAAGLVFAQTGAPKGGGYVLTFVAAAVVLGGVLLQRREQVTRRAAAASPS